MLKIKSHITNKLLVMSAARKKSNRVSLHCGIRADCQVDPYPLGLLANNIFSNLVGSKSCTVHANLHNDGLIIEALSRAARRAQCLEQREAYE